MTSIIVGTSVKHLFPFLSKNLPLEYVKTQVGGFADGELRIQISDSLYKKNVIIAQSTCKPANDHLMELLLTIDAARRVGSNNIIALIPYFGYSRQDKLSYKWGPISARLVANLLEAAGVNHVITVDFHSKQLEGFFKVGVQNIDATPLFASMLKNRKEIMIISPDVGGLNRAKNLALHTNNENNVAIINKSRHTYNDCQVYNIIGDVEWKECIIVDDIVDTGNTLCKAAELLITEGAKSVIVFITHGVFSGNAIEKIQKSPIKKVVVTNTIPQDGLPDKFFVADISPLLKEALDKVS